MPNLIHAQIASFTKTPIANDTTIPENFDQKHLAIYAHGISGFKDWGGMDLIAKQFAEEGIAFVKFNYSSNGTTPNHLTDFVDLEAYGNDNYCLRQHELDKMMDWINKEYPKVKDITIIGHSRGGVDALLFAANHGRVNRLITWAAPSNVKTPWSKWDEQKLQQWKQDGVMHILNGRTKQNMPIYYQLKRENELYGHELDIARAAAKVSVPWLIIHGDTDEAVPFAQAEELKAMQPKAVLKSIKETGHTFGRSFPWENNELPEASKELCELSIDFIQKH